MLILKEKILKKNDLADFTTDNKLIFDMFEVGKLFFAYCCFDHKSHNKNLNFFRVLFSEEVKIFKACNKVFGILLQPLTFYDGFFNEESTCFKLSGFL